MYFVSERLIYYLLTGQRKLLFISKKLSILNDIYFKAKFLHVNITTLKKMTESCKLQVIKTNTVCRHCNSNGCL